MQLADVHMAIHDEDAVIVGHAGYVLAPQRFRHKVKSPSEMDLADCRDTSNREAGGIDPRPGTGLIAPRAALIVEGRWLEAERFMRADVVVLLAKPVEASREAGERLRDTGPPEPLGERAVKALDLALSLWMPDGAKAEANALL